MVGWCFFICVKGMELHLFKRDSLFCLVVIQLSSQDLGVASGNHTAKQGSTEAISSLFLSTGRRKGSKELRNIAGIKSQTDTTATPRKNTKALKVAVLI